MTVFKKMPFTLKGSLYGSVNLRENPRMLPRDVGIDRDHAIVTRDEITGVNHEKYLAENGHTIIDNRW